MGFKITKLQLLQATDKPDKSGVLFHASAIADAVAKLEGKCLPVYGYRQELIGVATDIKLDGKGCVAGTLAVRSDADHDFGLASAGAYLGGLEDVPRLFCVDELTHVHAVEPGTLAFDRSE